MTTLALFARDVVPMVDSTDRQNTPRDLCDDLGEFDLDVASNPASMIRARRHYCLERGDDGLALPWVGSVWCNGPYSDPLPWCERLRDHAGPWAALWKLDPTTTWWRELMRGADGYGLFRKRLAFVREGNCGVANFGSVLFFGGGWRPSAAVVDRLWPVAYLKETARV